MRGFRFMTKLKIKKIEKYIPWILTLVPIISSLFLGLMKSYQYVIGQIFCSYYGINFDLFDLSVRGIFYDILFCFISVSIFGVASYYKGQFNFFKPKISDLKNIVYCLLCTIILSVYCWWSLELNLVEIIIFFIYMFLMEKFCFYIINKDTKKEVKFIDFKSGLFECLMSLILIFVIPLFGFGFSKRWDIENLKEYRIIDDNKAIVYTTNDYYVVLDCEEKDDVLYLKKGYETKITGDVKSKLKEYKKVIIK